MSKARDCAKKAGLLKEFEDIVNADDSITDEKLFDIFGKKSLDAKNREFQAQLQAIRVEDAHSFVDGYTQGKNWRGRELTDREAVRAYLTMDEYRAGRAGVEQQVASTQNYWGSRLNEMLDKAGNGTLRQRLQATGASFDRDFGRNVFKELKNPGTTGDTDARAVAKLWEQVTEEMRMAHMQAGGLINKLDDWAMPQRHLASKMLGVPKQTWIDDVFGMLDHARMVDADGNPLDAKALTRMLDKMYDNIVSNGKMHEDLANLPVGHRTKLGNKYRDHRVLHFKDDSYLTYMDKYGDGDVIGAMLDHTKGMSRDIGFLEAMGPDHHRTYQSLRSRAEAREMIPVEGKPGEFTMGSQRGMNNLDAIWANMAGFENTGNANLQTWATNFRTLASLAKLGGALISSIPDTAFGATTAFYNGTGVGRWGKQWLKQMTPFMRGQEQARAVRMGYMQHKVLDDFLGSSRFAEPNTIKTGRVLSDAFYKATLLTPWERGQRTSFRMAMVDGLSDSLSKSTKFADMTTSQQRRQLAMLKKYGISEQEWASLRSTQKAENGNAIDLMEIKDAKLRTKFGAMVETESNIGVIKPTARTNAVTNQGLSAGTWAGEFVRSAAQWKSFPIAYQQTQMARMANVTFQGHADQVGFQLAYWMYALTSALTMGVASVYLSELSKGRTPRDLDSPLAFGALLLQGGMKAGIGGLWYDAIIGQSNGVDAMKLLSPPAWQMFSDILGAAILPDLTDDQVFDMDDYITNLVGTVASGAIEWVPGQSIWYLRSSYHEAIRRPTAELLASDIGYDRALNRLERREQRAAENGQEVFTEGSPLPHHWDWGAVWGK